MQREIPLGPMPTASMRSLDFSEVAHLGCPQSAVEAVLLRSNPKRTRDSWADAMGASRGEVTKRFNGRFAEAVRQLVEFERIAHCRAITQYMAHQHGGLWVPREISEEERTQARIAELEAELEKARNAA